MALFGCRELINMKAWNRCQGCLVQYGWIGCQGCLVENRWIGCQGCLVEYEYGTQGNGMAAIPENELNF